MRSEQAKGLATLAGGCFWCLEAVYKGLRGVERVVSDYAGGVGGNGCGVQRLAGEMLR